MGEEYSDGGWRVRTDAPAPARGAAAPRIATIDEALSGAIRDARTLVALRSAASFELELLFVRIDQLMLQQAQTLSRDVPVTDGRQ